MQDLILLHGALGAKSQFENLIPLLQSDYSVHSFNFDGHGGEKSAEKFSIPLFSKNLVDFIREKQLNKPLIFGYSMGGYVAIHCAAHFPDYLGDIVTLGTKFDWNPESARKEASMLDPDIIEQKVPKFAEYLEQHHGESWKIMMRKTAEMMLDLGKEPTLSADVLSSVRNKVTLHLGDQDTMVSEAETREVAEKIPAAKMKIVPECPHPIQKVPNALLSQLIRESFDHVQQADR